MGIQAAQDFRHRRVHVDRSLAIIFFLIMSSLALGLFPGWHPDWGPGLAWGTALAVRWIALHEPSLTAPDVRSRRPSEVLCWPCAPRAGPARRAQLYGRSGAGRPRVAYRLHLLIRTGFLHVYLPALRKGYLS